MSCDDGVPGEDALAEDIASDGDVSVDEGKYMVSPLPLVVVKLEEIPALLPAIELEGGMPLDVEAAGEELEETPLDEEDEL